MTADPTPKLTGLALLRQEIAERAAAAPKVEAEPAQAYKPHAEFERDAYGRHERIVPTDCEGILRVVDQGGVVWLCRCDVCGFDVGVPMLQIEPDRLRSHRLERAGIPAEFAGKAFDRSEKTQKATVDACRAWVSEFRTADLVASIPAPALFGRNGRGKSHLLATMVEGLIKRHAADAIYRSAQAMFDELHAAMNGDGGYDSRLHRLQTVDVLALDDLGAGRMTEWRMDVLDALIDARYADRRPLLIGTNIPPTQWEDVFGHRAASRMRGMCRQLELRGQDRRAQQALAVF